jgi:AraC family transcriptional regulator of adaptative response/methylated-DNA-[protein]-cysteine methyltransferase
MPQAKERPGTLRRNEEKKMTNIVCYATGQSVLGSFVAALSEHGLALVEFGAMTASNLAARFPEAETVEDAAALRTTIDAIAATIDNPSVPCDLAIDLRGADFELAVWHALRDIPAGTTTTYGELATRLGMPHAAREVGEACAANRLAVIVPCHRVLKKDGSISGYRWGVRRKRALLERERVASLLHRPAIVAHGAA